MLSAPAANTYVEHSGASDAGCAWMISGGGALARHRCVRDGHHALFDANHHLSADKALSASHATGAEQWYWQRGAWWHGVRPVWGTPYYSGDDYSSSSVELLSRSGAQGSEGGTE